MQSNSIFEHTYASFCDFIGLTLGKGRTHAGLVYEEFFRQGEVTGQNLAFNNAKALFNGIVEAVDFTHPAVVCARTDGSTRKILLQVEGKLEVEAVLIPMQAGGTLCVSSQVGCRMGCAFCETGRMGLLRHLTAAEIVSQVFVARHLEKFPVRNIVFMGMGEPFDNYDNVMQAVRILCDPKGLGFGPRHVTVSTSGCIEGIYKLIHEGSLAPNLAVSINAPSDEERNRLMPVNRRHNMQQLYEAMQAYCRSTGRQILAAYVLLRDQNDSPEHADRLAAYLQGLNVKINLIPYNPQTRDRFAAPSLEVIDAFAARLRLLGYRTLLRGTKGQGIMAACGQLGNAELRKRTRMKASSQ